MRLVKNTIEVECLIQSLQNAMEAKMEHDKAYDSFNGYSWGYHGRLFIEAKENAADEFGKRLDTLIEKKVAEAMERERSNA
jgi:hypothetical protein